MVNGMIAAVRHFLRKAGWDRTGVHFLLAVSGGADSMALLNVFSLLARRCGYRLTVAHLDHGLRGAAGAADAAFVADHCRALGLSLACARADVRGWARRQRVSLEMAARECRYRFLAQTQARVGADAVVTAHTADDQAETVLLKWLRGSGPAGLAGIAPETRHHGLLILHPLLTVTRREIEGYLKRQGQCWREDATNRDCRFQRNRVRQELLPGLERAFNPRIRRVLCETADRLHCEDEALTEWAGRSYLRCQVAGSALDGAKLRKLPEAVRRRVLVRWLTERGADLQRLTHPAITRLSEEVCAGLPGGERRVAGLDVRMRADRLEAHPVPRRAAPRTVNRKACRLAVPGQTELKADGVRVTAHWRAGFEKSAAKKVGIYPAQAVIRPPDKGALFWRGWRAGDRLAVRGVGHRKLQDILTDLKVPRSERARVRVIASRTEVVWLPGYRVSRDWEVTDPKGTNLWLTISA